MELRYECLARSRVYAYLSHGFLYPDEKAALFIRHQGPVVKACLEALGLEHLLPVTASIGEAFSALGLPALEEAYVATFGHTISKECPPYETEYGLDDIFQKTQALADINAFYQAFGVEPALPERLDHLSMELEFMQLLTLKEAYALSQGGQAERVALCQQAQAQFLKSHLGCWISSFVQKLPVRGGSIYDSLGKMTEVFVAWDLERYGLVGGPALDMGEGQAPDCSGCSMDGVEGEEVAT